MENNRSMGKNTTVLHTRELTGQKWVFLTPSQQVLSLPGVPVLEAFPGMNVKLGLSRPCDTRRAGPGPAALNKDRPYDASS